MSDCFNVYDATANYLGCIFVTPNASLEQIIRALKGEGIIGSAERFNTFESAVQANGDTILIKRTTTHNGSRTYTLKLHD